MPGKPYFELDLVLLASNAGLSLTDTFVVNFQQHDNYYFAGGNDGFLFDAVSVTGASAIPEPAGLLGLAGVLSSSLLIRRRGMARK